MKGYLLDTSICVAIFRGNRQVAAKLNKVSKEQCFISQIVVAELLFGAYRSKHVEENLEQTREFIKEVKVLPFDDCLDAFAKERAWLWDAGI
jgi:tRNA(fMet)-specific endonuclease VapC